MSDINSDGFCKKYGLGSETVTFSFIVELDEFNDKRFVSLTVYCLSKCSNHI